MSDFERHIQNYLDAQRPCLISDAMKYSMEGGKRFRPRIIFAILKGLGIDESVGYDAALALELIQTYSLIHDDLPAMDNDDMRRGKPSLHKAFREDIAILTGDQLLTNAFRVIGESSSYDAECKVKIITALSKYAGIDGMIYGQLLDVTSDNENIDKEKLVEIQDNKTGGLFKISCLIPMYIAKIDREEYFTRMGSLIGLIFQNQDDLFDVIKSEKEMGKSLSDARNEKGSALSVYSLDELKQLIDEEFNELDELLKDAGFDTSYLMKLLDKLKNR
ncbi:MAG: polyprenyl synthetase family protein [Erysipelotrichaceae bacterium]|jgi:geranylgeranyl diphosphate synthase type II|nr:polyprenyl synthetase family protein [Erysipelotrichaceae bacterium]MBQ1740620.1 polyprenyl synthetase family protein [Erysipelotrichaceae bacterium]MBQ1910259.1 polyprenyl synthetase family protein [Erysipelotrichaceae bacterium]MBQ2137908.1 polyprenyl synthetase family protein [Erysipelotrichaceae bacterium]MBQ2506388.1 polyprenyl synthetase family protein [Erysipelotrichaceae bacterium]